MTKVRRLLSVETKHGLLVNKKIIHYISSGNIDVFTVL